MSVGICADIVDAETTIWPHEPRIAATEVHVRRNISVEIIVDIVVASDVTILADTTRITGTARARRS